MFDWLITDAEILDGSGAAAIRGDVAIEGGRIAAVGRLADREARHRLKARGRTLTPGFIDIHRHADAALFRPNFGRAELKQGLTTILNGNCGMSAAPVCGAYTPEILRYLAPITGQMPPGQIFSTLADYWEYAARLPLALNIGMLVGMGVLRADVAGFADQPLTDEQYRQLHRLLEQALADGALGVSLGLGYAPECFYTTAELLRALEPLKNTGTVITVHMRQEGDGVVAALREMLGVARKLGTPVEISHLKAIGSRNWHRAVPEMLRLIAQARKEGVDVSCDVYPYTAGSTQLIHVLPPEFQSGGTEVLTARLQNSETRRAIRARMESGEDFENITRLVGFKNIRTTGLKAPEDRAFEGQTIAQIAQAEGKEPFDALFDLLADERCEVSMIDFIASKEDIGEILNADFSSVISDAIYPSEGLLHPRVYGMVAHLLETCVKQDRILTLPQAVHKLTRMPADRFGLEKKGRIEVGADADLCLFDPEVVHENDTYADPAEYAGGMDWVFVGGQSAIEEGVFMEHYGGEILCR